VAAVAATAGAGSGCWVGAGQVLQVLAGWLARQLLLLLAAPVDAAAGCSC